MDNRDHKAILAQLAGGESLPEPLAAASLNACARELLRACRQNLFQAELPQFRQLCQLATNLDPGLAHLATSHLYRQVIEPLGDDFSDSACTQVHQVLAGLITFIATTPSGGRLGELLDHCQLASSLELLGRWQQLAMPPSLSATELAQIETILIPSRITAGADVAITSILLQRLTSALPQAEILLLGPAHLRELFHGLPRVRHLPFEIDRHGNLAARLLFWPDLVATTSAALAGYPAGHVLVVDPDSRLSQLGLLPIVPGARHCHFPSQTLTGPPGEDSLTALANRWLDGWLGTAPPAFPLVAPPPAKVTAATGFCARLRAAGAEHLLLVNLGVGGDPRKSLPEEIENQLLERLLARENTIIILDMGCGSEEKVRAEKLLVFLAAAGCNTTRLKEEALAAAPAPFRHGAVASCSTLGTLAALTGVVDCYLGYDSCGQHLANGANTRAVTVFAGYPSERFLQRWSPLSRSGQSCIVPVPDRDPSPAQFAALLEKISATVLQPPSPR